MTTGELDFDSIFRQDPTGESDSAEEIPFPSVSYVLWIIFVIMPILLTNMLVCNNYTDLYSIIIGVVIRLVLLLEIFKLFKMKLPCKSWLYRYS